MSDPASSTLDPAELARRSDELSELLAIIRPAIEADGGELHLIAADVITGVVRVALSGACGSCSVSSMTLEGGIERILHQRLAWFTSLEGEVWGGTEA